MSVGVVSIVIGVVCLFLSAFAVSFRGVNFFHLGWGFITLGALVLG